VAASAAGRLFDEISWRLDHFAKSLMPIGSGRPTRLARPTMTVAQDQRLGGLHGAPRLSWQALAFWAGLAALAAPTLVANARQSWSTEQGEQSPIVLAIGLWLLARRWPEMRAAAQPSSRWLAVALGVMAAVAYVLGRVADQFLIESYALYALALVGLYALLGSRSLARGWFPLAYLIFALPAPYTLTWLLTSHLRLWITQAAVATFQAFGFSVVRDGLNILIDQYELAVRDACSGMNSLVSLSAIGLVYIYLRRTARWWYFAVMAVPIVGLAIFGNFVRVCVLVALTHYFGDAVAQSYLHEGAGVVTFAADLLGVMAIDAIVAPILLKPPGPVSP
jgi:exosortase